VLQDLLAVSPVLRHVRCLLSCCGQCWKEKLSVEAAVPFALPAPGEEQAGVAADAADEEARAVARLTQRSRLTSTQAAAPVAQTAPCALLAALSLAL